MPTLPDIARSAAYKRSKNQFFSVFITEFLKRLKNSEVKAKKREIDHEQTAVKTKKTKTNAIQLSQRKRKQQ